MPQKPNIAAIVLAAGMSRRMGRPKALLPLGDKPLIHRVVQSIAETDSLTCLIVVTGHCQKKVTAALRGFDVHFVHNPNYDAGGMLSSVQAGIRAVPIDIAAVLIVLGDQPLIRPETVQSIVNAWKSSTPRLVIPAYHGQRGHPVLIDRSGRSEVLALHGDETLKTFVTRHTSDAIELSVEDPATITDVDTPEDYERLLKQLNSLDGSPDPAVKPDATRKSSPTRKKHVKPKPAAKR